MNETFCFIYLVIGVITLIGYYFFSWRKELKELAAKGERIEMLETAVVFTVLLWWLMIGFDVYHYFKKKK